MEHKQSSHRFPPPQSQRRRENGNSTNLNSRFMFSSVAWQPTTYTNSSRSLLHQQLLLQVFIRVSFMTELWKVSYRLKMNCNVSLRCKAPDPESRSYNKAPINSSAASGSHTYIFCFLRGTCPTPSIRRNECRTETSTYDPLSLLWDGRRETTC